jgi:MFS family permease
VRSKPSRACSPRLIHLALSTAITFAGRVADRIRRSRVILLAAALLATAAVGSGLAAQVVAGSPKLKSGLPYLLYALFACLSLLVLRAGPEQKRREPEEARPLKPTVRD